jgi:PKD repeat protein
MTCCNPPNGADLSWTPITPTIGEVVTLDGTAGGTPPLTFVWAFGDGSSGSGAHVTHAYAAAGDYTVVMTVSNGCGNQAVQRVIHVVAGCNPPHDAAFSWTPPIPGVGAPVTFDGTAGGSPPLVYAWDLGDGSGDSGAIVVHTYAAAGIYTVVLTATNGCGRAVATHTVTVAGGQTWQVYLPLVARGYAP